MNQKEIIKDIAEKNGLTQSKTKEILDIFIEETRRQLIDLKPVTVPNFGRFNIVKQKGRWARVPRKENAIVIQPHYKAVFEPSTHFKEEVHALKRIDPN